MRDRRRDYAFASFGRGRIFSTSACGRGITCTDTSSPTRRAAAAPASVAAFTAPTSPRTRTVTYPAPMYSLPTRTTFAALTIASAASTEPIRPRVSTMPSASDAIGVTHSNRIAEYHSTLDVERRCARLRLSIHSDSVHWRLRAQAGHRSAGRHPDRHARATGRGDRHAHRDDVPFRRRRHRTGIHGR